MQIENKSHVFDLVISNKVEYVKLDIYNLSIASIEILDYVENEKYVESYLTLIRARDIAIKNKNNNKMLKTMNFFIRFLI